MPTASVSHIKASQVEVEAFLQSAESYALPVKEVTRIDTHGAMVFLAGPHVYKIKRAVAYPYMDFSTLERRRRACEREVELNRRTAPEIYLEVIAIVRTPQGTLAFGGPGPVVEWAVRMKRFAQQDLFDELARAGKLTLGQMSMLADAVRAFHDAAEQVRDPTYGAAALRAVITETAREFTEQPDLFPPAATQELTANALERHAAVAELLDRRLQAGNVRRCHGDLHLRNIFLYEGAPRLFDAIEFNDAMACIDVFYDLSFLLMDLDHRGLREFANIVLNRYLRDCEEFQILQALPLFHSVRAAIRAKVAASTAAAVTDPKTRAAKEEEAGQYFAAASEYLSAPPPQMVVIGGLSGSGKTSVARVLAPQLGRCPGALHLRSDVLRKRLLGFDELERLPSSGYTKETTRRVYAALIERAGSALAAGHTVILDAVYLRVEERQAIAAAARNLDVPFLGVWLEAPEERLLQRVVQRQGNASDADADIVRMQNRVGVRDLTWARVDADRPVSKVVDEVHQLLSKWPGR